MKNEKEQTERETTLLFLRKEGGEFFFKREREFSYALRLLFALQREREREKKRNEEDALHPSEKRSCFVVLPRFLPLDSFEYLFLKREEEEEQSLGEERNSST